MKLKLSELMNGYPIKQWSGERNSVINSIAYDSRQVEAGGLFVALPGTREDGARFIKDAVSRNAAGFITQTPSTDLQTMKSSCENKVSQIFVNDARHALAFVSDRFYEHPSKSLRLTGITGTNGKTTLTYLLEAMRTQAGQSCGVIGSINYRFGGQSNPASVTTPQSLDLNRMLAEMVEGGATDCFLEVSSHAIAQQRVGELIFDVAVFTNLTRDHLDYHGHLAHYQDTKKSLFLEGHVDKQVVNIDDPVGREIVAETSRPTLTTGIESKADVRAESIELSSQGVTFILNSPYGNARVQSPLLGQHNVRNLLSAAAVGLLQGLSLDAVCAGLESLRAIPGRFEKIENSRGITVLVDFAHTDDALLNALTAVRGFTSGRVIVVFGCGGDRDATKRGPMGRIALEHSDLAIITSDNPRTEDPKKIIEDICVGLPESTKEGQHYHVIVERQPAIEQAIHIAQKGDTVLIAGKGHENYQILGTKTIPFDDREIAHSFLN